MSRVYGYCRLALANEEIMAQQRQEIEDYCKNNDLKVDAYFCDNGVSGLTKNREYLQSMLKGLCEGDIVIITNHARLSRGLHQYLDITKEIYASGAVLKIINE